MYVSNMRDLFHQPSEEAYRKMLEQLKTRSSETFYDSVHPKVSMYCIHNYAYLKFRNLMENIDGQDI